MNIRCPRCDVPAEPAGNEDARAFFACPVCRRVWPIAIQAEVFLEAADAQRPARVLLVDDSNQMLLLLEHWLAGEPCTLLTAMSGREALDVAAGFAPEIAIVDLVLPPPDGWRICEALQQRFGTEVVLMTGVIAGSVRERADEAGVRLLEKPLSEEMVVDAFRRARAARARALPVP